MNEHVAWVPDAGRAGWSDPVGRFAVAALLVGLIANAIGHSFVLIVLPALGRQMGFGDIQTGLLLSLAAVALTVSGPLWGLVSESWGRRRVLLVGLGAAAGFPAALALIVEARFSSGLTVASALLLLMALRLAASAISGGIMPAAQAYMADVTTAERRAGGMGLIGAAFGVGSMAGAGMAAALGGSHPALALWLVAGLVLAGTSVVAVRLRDIPGSRQPRQSGGGRVPWRAVWRFFLITVCGLSVYSLLQQVTALRLQDAFGMPPADSIRTAGAALMASMAVMIATQGLVVRWLRWSPERLLRVGSLGAAAAMLAAALAPNMMMLVLGTAGLGAGFGLLLPGNLAALSVRTDAGAQGKVAGLNAIGQGAGMAIGPLTGAALHQLSATAPYWVGAAVLVLTCALTFWPSRPAFAE